MKREIMKLWAQAKLLSRAASKSNLAWIPSRLALARSSHFFYLFIAKCQVGRLGGSTSLLPSTTFTLHLTSISKAMDLILVPRTVSRFLLQKYPLVVVNDSFKFPISRLRAILAYVDGTTPLGCVYIQKCLWFQCYHSIARKYELHGQKHYCLIKFFFYSFWTHQKQFPLFPLFSCLISFKILRN